MPPKRRARTILLRSALALGVLYVLSYVVASTGGHYEPTAFGLGRAPDGRAVLRPKFGYEWHPFALYTDKGNSTVPNIFYAPLIALDQELWHTRERAKRLEDPIKNYFDKETGTYRDLDGK